ncbi:MAG: MFS transporter [Anaerolineae bacterium]
MTSEHGVEQGAIPHEGGPEQLVPIPGERGFRTRLLAMFLARMALNTSFRIIYPFLPSIARGLGISLAQAGGLISLRMAGSLAAPFLGPLVDRYGRRRSMAFALCAFTLATLLLAGVGTLLAAAAAFLLIGLAKAIYDPAVYAYLGDTVPYQRRGRVTGFLELSWSLGWLVGVPASGFLIERLGWRAPWAFLAVWGFLGVWLVQFGVPLASPGAARVRLRTMVRAIGITWRGFLHRREVVVLLATGLLLTLANEIPFIVYGGWLESSFGLSLSTLGLASSVVGMADAAAELGAMAFVDRLGKRRGILTGLSGLAASLILLPGLARFGLLPTLAGVVLMMLTFEFGIVSLLPVATELAPGARGSLFSLVVTTFSLGRILGAVVGGWLWTWQDIALHARVGAACALLGALLLAWGVKEVGG